MTTFMKPKYIVDSRKTAVLNNELHRLKNDNTALKETKNSGSGSTKKRIKIFILR